MQVLRSGCQIPAFRLRWLETVWRSERISHQGRRYFFKHIWDGSSLYTQAGTAALIMWWISTAFLCIFYKNPSSQSFDLSLLSCFPLSYCTGTHHRVGLINSVCASDVFASLLPSCHTRCCVVRSHSYRSQHLEPFFIYEWQIYPSHLLCCLAVKTERICERSRQVKYT